MTADSYWLSLVCPANGPRRVRGTKTSDILEYQVLTRLFPSPSSKWLQAPSTREVLKLEGLERHVLDFSGCTSEPPPTTFPFVYIITSASEGQIKLVATFGFLPDVDFSVDSAASYKRAVVIYPPEWASCLTSGIILCNGYIQQFFFYLCC